MAGPPGYAELVRGGWLVPLGPGLLAGTPLLDAVVERLSGSWERACRDLGARPIVLPASEGEALVNVLLHAGAATAEVPVWAFAQGAGFREAATPGHPGPTQGPGLGSAQLYPRLDLVSVGPRGSASLRTMVAMLVGQLAGWGLDLRPADVDEAAPRAEVDLAAPQGEGPPEVVGRVTARPVSAEAGGPRACLATLDLFAVVGALAEQHHDDRGLCWPVAAAPWLVGVVPPPEDGPGLAPKLVGELADAGLPALLDDRPLDPATKRGDLERWGLPLRLLCGPAAARGQLVVEARQGGEPTRVAAAALVDHVRRRLGLGDRARDARARRRRATW